MNTDRKLLSLKNDYVFRKVFGNNEDIMADFLSAVLDIPEDEFEELKIVDPDLLPEYSGDKLSRLDVKVFTKSGIVIDAEIQLRRESGLRRRLIYYTSKIFTEQMTRGDRYNTIKKAVSIVITGFNFITDSKYYHNRYQNGKVPRGIAAALLV